MKKIACLFICTMMIFSSSKGQAGKKDKTETSTVHKHEKGKPEVTVKVNKHYDKKGNLVSFDSAYTSYYAGRKDDKILMDSLVDTFKNSGFTEQFLSMNDQNFKDMFFTDSLLNGDFFHQDFFRKRLELNEKYMQRRMWQMDSVKNGFFKKQAQQINK